MLMLAVQSLLLILAAFIAGAMIACFFRRVFFSRDNERPTPDGGRGLLERGEETVTTTTTTKTTETRTGSSAEATRFGRALTGTTGALASATGLTSNDTTNVEKTPPVSDAPTTLDDRAPEVKAVEEPQMEASPASPSPGDATRTETAVVASGVVASAVTGANDDGGAAITPQTVEAVSETPPQPGAPAQSTSPTDISLSSSSDVAMLRSVRSEALVGSEATASDDNVFRLPISSRANVDNLKRIRGIGVLIEKKLNAMGVRTYEQIANWTAGDVDRVSESLDFKGRIERESWIEQARILSSGGFTEFSRRG